MIFTREVLDLNRPPNNEGGEGGGDNADARHLFQCFGRRVRLSRSTTLAAVAGTVAWLGICANGLGCED